MIPSKDLGKWSLFANIDQTKDKLTVFTEGCQNCKDIWPYLHMNMQTKSLRLCFVCANTQWLHNCKFIPLTEASYKRSSLKLLQCTQNKAAQKLVVATPTDLSLLNRHFTYCWNRHNLEEVFPAPLWHRACNDHILFQCFPLGPSIAGNGWFGINQVFLTADCSTWGQEDSFVLHTISTQHCCFIRKQ